jgi:hypothetical protein
MSVGLQVPHRKEEEKKLSGKATRVEVIHEGGHLHKKEQKSDFFFSFL